MRPFAGNDLPNLSFDRFNVPAKIASEKDFIIFYKNDSFHRHILPTNANFLPLLPYQIGT